MFRFMHGYMPKYWDAQVKAGLVGENDGIYKLAIPAGGYSFIKVSNL